MRAIQQQERPSERPITILPKAETAAAKPAKVQPLIDPTRSRPEIITQHTLPSKNLDEIIVWLSEQLIDVAGLRYEGPLEENQPLSYDVLQRLSALTYYEVLLLAHPNEASKRFFAGEPGAVHPDSLMPADRRTINSLNPGRIESYLSYPILDDKGRIEPLFWSFGLRSRPGGDPYPSYQDLHAFRGCRARLIISPSGLTIFSNPTQDRVELPQYIPEKTRQYCHSWVAHGVLRFNGMPAIYQAIKQQAAKQASLNQNNHQDVDPSHSAQALEIAAKKILCSIFGVQVRVIPWSERDLIEEILKKLQQGTFVQEDYLTDEKEGEMRGEVR